MPAKPTKKQLEDVKEFLRSAARLEYSKAADIKEDIKLHRIAPSRLPGVRARAKSYIESYKALAAVADALESI